MFPFFIGSALKRQRISHFIDDLSSRNLSFFVENTLYGCEAVIQSGMNYLVSFSAQRLAPEVSFGKPQAGFLGLSTFLGI
jgi:hypothetical protein